VTGATAWQAFRKVIVPLAAPGVFTAAISTFFFAWNDFVFGISLTHRRGPAGTGRPGVLHRCLVLPAAHGGHLAAAVVVTIPVVILVSCSNARSSPA